MNSVIHAPFKQLGAVPLGTNSKSPFEVGVFVLELLTEDFFRVHRVFIFLGRSKSTFYFDADCLRKRVKVT